MGPIKKKKASVPFSRLSLHSGCHVWRKLFELMRRENLISTGICCERPLVVFLVVAQEKIEKITKTVGIYPPGIMIVTLV